MNMVLYECKYIYVYRQGISFGCLPQFLCTLGFEAVALISSGTRLRMYPASLRAHPFYLSSG